jgi:hypothetical protein
MLLNGGASLYPTYRSTGSCARCASHLLPTGMPNPTVVTKSVVLGLRAVSVADSSRVVFFATYSLTSRDLIGSFFFVAVLAWLRPGSLDVSVRSRSHAAGSWTSNTMT